MKKFKPWLIPFGVLAVVIVIVLQLKRIGDLFKYLFSNPQVNTFEHLDESGSVIDDFDAKRIAEGLYSAMNEFGTDEDRINFYLSDLNKGDFGKVYNAFGLRVYSPLTSQGSTTGVKLNLWEWLFEELSNDELNDLKQINPLIF